MLNLFKCVAHLSAEAVIDSGGSLIRAVVNDVRLTSIENGADPDEGITLVNLLATDKAPTGVETIEITLISPPVHTKIKDFLPGADLNTLIRDKESWLGIRVMLPCHCRVCKGTGVEFPGNPRTEKCEACDGTGHKKVIVQ